MPLPNPTPNEKKAEFLGRCMGDETMNTEFPENDQRYAVCNSQWEKTSKSKFPLDLVTVERLSAMSSLDLHLTHRFIHQAFRNSDTDAALPVHKLIVTELALRKIAHFTPIPEHFISKGPYVRHRCMDCAASPTHDILWAEGMARAWFCDKHYDKFKEVSPGEMVAEKTVRYGVVGVHYRDYVTKEEAMKYLDKHHLDPIAGPEEKAITQFLHAELVKADSRRRFTYGVVYQANRADAHGEGATPEELQEALWGHVRAGDRRVYVQHGKIESIGFKRAGEWVEIATIPFEFEAELKLPNQPVRKAKIPAGSIIMGVIWDQWAWDLVEKGLIRGYSFGGLAGREPA